MRALSIAIALVAGACTAPTVASETPPARSVGHAAQVGCKPTAPVQLHATARAVRGGMYEVTVVGTADTDVHDLALSLVLPPNATLRGGSQRISFGPTKASQTHAWTTRVHVRGAGATLHARAITELAPGLAPARVAAIALGAPAQQARRAVRTIAVGGEHIDEVRP